MVDTKFAVFRAVMPGLTLRRKRLTPAPSRRLMRIGPLCCFGLLLIFGTMLAAQTPGPCLGVSGTAYVNWPQFHSDPCHTGYNASEVILSPANVENLVLDWKYNTGPEIDNSSPTVANGVVYIGDEESGISAVNAATGAKLWSFTTTGDEESAPAVANGLVYFGGDNCCLYALNALTGATVWVAGVGSYSYSRHGCQRRGIYRLRGRESLRVQRLDRRSAVELPYRWRCLFCACGGEWGGVFRLL